MPCTKTRTHRAGRKSPAHLARLGVEAACSSPGTEELRVTSWVSSTAAVSHRAVTGHLSAPVASSPISFLSRHLTLLASPRPALPHGSGSSQGTQSEAIGGQAVTQPDPDSGCTKIGAFSCGMSAGGCGLVPSAVFFPPASSQAGSPIPSTELSYGEERCVPRKGSPGFVSISRREKKKKKTPFFL